MLVSLEIEIKPPTDLGIFVSGILIKAAIGCNWNQLVHMCLCLLHDAPALEVVMLVAYDSV
jgi:hypothetical protein